MRMKLNWSKASLGQLLTIMKHEECSNHYKERALGEMKRRMS
jgi:hypothetical protein